MWGTAENRSEHREEGGGHSGLWKAAGVGVWPSPVESVAHLDGNQHGQGHGHGLGGLEDLTVQALKVRVFLVALHEVSLQGAG